MTAVKSLCVYCGSASGIGETYRAVARELGSRMAAEGTPPTLNCRLPEPFAQIFVAGIGEDGCEHRAFIFS